MEKLFESFKTVGKAPEHLTGIFDDSRKVISGSVFVAIKGHQVDGNKYLGDVCTRGVSVVVVQNQNQVPKSFKGLIVLTDNTQKAMGLLASRWYGEPSRHMLCIGVTGTNGKTTITYLIKKIFEASGKRIAVIGTNGHQFEDRSWDTRLTTPNALLLQGRLAEFRKLGAQAVVMEVSSHAIDQQRIMGIHFDACIFTNLSRDHIGTKGDHPNMEAYFAAKESLFTNHLAVSKKEPKVAIINSDSHYGKKLVEVLQKTPGIQCKTYGSQKSDYNYIVTHENFEETKFELNKTPVSIPLICDHNVANAVAALSVSDCLGLDWFQSIGSLKVGLGVKGRLEKVPNKKELQIFVDYAHTPDALERVIGSLKSIRDHHSPNSKIIVVFGCGGDRDPGKRPLMGKAVQKDSDIMVITSDNPRTENPWKIIQDIQCGILKGDQVHVEPDRKKALKLSIDIAQKGDIVLIAGKGHEDYQVIGTERLPFSDVDVIKEFLGDS